MPYSPTSFYALNEDYISLDKLIEDGLIKSAETREQTDRAVYDSFKEKYYIEAFIKFRKTKEYKDFIANKEMVKYSEFMHKKNKKNNKCS